MPNPRLDDLIPCPFQRRAALREGIAPPAEASPIARSLGEARRAAAALVPDTPEEHGQEAARRGWRKAAVRMLPGSRPCPRGDELSRPGAALIRLALVHEDEPIGAALQPMPRVPAE